MPDDEIQDAIEENALGPKRAQGDTGSIEQHPLPDQIAAAKFINSKQANTRGLPIRYVKIVPPGTV